MTSQEKFYSFFNEIVCADFPDAKIKFKDTSQFMKILGFFIKIFNKRFMKDFTTVLGNTVYFPSKEWLESDYAEALDVIAHEYVHMVDRSQEKKFMFELKYAFPQIIAILGFATIFALFHPIFMLFGLFFLALFPLPSPWRLKYEMNGYAMNAFFGNHFPNFDMDRYANRISQLLAGSDYYFPSYSAFDVKDRFLRNYAQVAISHPAFLKVATWLDKIAD